MSKIEYDKSMVKCPKCSSTRVETRDLLDNDDEVICFEYYCHSCGHSGNSEE